MTPFPAHPFFTPLLEKAPFGIVAWHLADESDDLSMRLAFCNEAAERITKQKFQSRVGERLVDLFPDTDHARVRRYADVARNGTPWKGVVRGRAAELKETFSMQVFPADGRLAIVMFENLTDERTARAEILRLNLFLDSLIENLPLMLFVKRASWSAGITSVAGRFESSRQPLATREARRRSVVSLQGG